MDATRADLGKAKESLDKAKKDRGAEMRVRKAAIMAAELEVRHKGKAVQGSEAALREEEDEEINSISEAFKNDRKVKEDHRKSQVLKDDSTLPRRAWLPREPKASGSTTASVRAHRQQTEG